MQVHRIVHTTRRLDICLVNELVRVVVPLGADACAVAPASAKSAESPACAEFSASSVDVAASTIFGIAYYDSLAVAGSTVGGSR